MVKYKMVNPPSGETYGFPKKMPAHIEPTMPGFDHFLTTNGYPNNLVNAAKDFSLIWSEDSDERKR